MKLTQPMIRALRSIHEHGHLPYVRGQAAHGGLAGTMKALQTRGLVEWDRQAGDYRLTDAGREALPK